MPVPEAQESTVRAGIILLLIGGIIRLVSGVFLAVVGVVMFVVLPRIGDLSSTDGMVAGWMGIVYVIWGILWFASGFVAFYAYGRAKRGERHVPGVIGIVLSLLPPVDVVLLLAGVFLLSSDEAKAERDRRRQTPV